MSPSIWLPSGNYFNFLDLDSNKWSIEDIAHNLSQICRFNGAIPRFYSVAEHSVYVSRVLGPEDLRLPKLLHDAQEAWVGDVTAPLKQLLPDYQLFEDRIQTHTLARFGIATPLHRAVKIADRRVFIAESLQLRGLRDDDWDLEPADVTIRCLPPHEAKMFFLREYDNILLSEIRRKAG